jgi:hypothetical protein
VLTDWGEDTLLVPTLIIIKSTELKFTLLEESKSQQKFHYTCNTNSKIITSNITNFNKEIYIHVYPMKRKSYWLVSRFFQVLPNEKMYLSNEQET